MHVSVSEVLMSLLAVMKSYERVNGRNSKATNINALLVHQKTKYNIFKIQPPGPCFHSGVLIVISLLYEKDSKLSCLS